MSAPDEDCSNQARPSSAVCQKAYLGRSEAGKGARHLTTFRLRGALRPFSAAESRRESTRSHNSRECPSVKAIPARYTGTTSSSLTLRLRISFAQQTLPSRTSSRLWHKTLKVARLPTARCWLVSIPIPRLPQLTMRASRGETIRRLRARTLAPERRLTGGSSILDELKG
jgi:hypothetical protein